MGNTTAEPGAQYWAKDVLKFCKPNLHRDCCDLVYVKAVTITTEGDDDQNSREPSAVQ
jgi:hypothetical protein